MRIRQCHTVLRFFKPTVFKKYGFTDYSNFAAPTVFWGMYPSSRRKLISHRGFAVVVWRGSDSINIHKQTSFVQWCKDHHERVKHIAISNFIEDDLRKAGLPFVSLPITSADFTPCHLMPRGDKIYTYTSKPGSGLIDYGLRMANEVSRKTGIPLIVAHSESMPRTRLINEAYRNCFIGLRLLAHDGLSNSVMEMGLCGRQVVTNLQTPNALPYRDVKDVIGIVQRSFALRKEDNQQIAIDMQNFINISTDWLDTKYWEGKP